MRSAKPQQTQQQENQTRQRRSCTTARRTAAAISLEAIGVRVLIAAARILRLVGIGARVRFDDKLDPPGAEESWSGILAQALLKILLNARRDRRQPLDVHECIQTRRSLRKYETETIDEQKLERVLEAVRWAPSWVNFQPWEVVVVDDPQVKAALQECVPEGNPGRKSITVAPVVLAVCGRQGESGFSSNQPSTVYGDWVMFDLGIACQNICLAAWAEGLGTLHLGLLDHDRAGQTLGLPDRVRCYELIPLGVPGKIAKTPKRRTIEEFTHKNRYGS